MAGFGDRQIRERYVVGVDDTDVEGGDGTSRLVRALADHVTAEGFGEPLGVSRHQLWSSEKVKATTKNRAIALVIETDREVLDVEDFVVDFVRDRLVSGANPGVAILTRHSDMPHALAFGRRAKQELLTQRDVDTYATESNVLVRGLGGTREGVIGALAAAGLRAGGNDGVLIALRDLRALSGRVRAGEIRERTGIQQIIDEDTGEPLDRDDVVDTMDWLRASLASGEPVILTRRSKEERRVWLPLLRRGAA